MAEHKPCPFCGIELTQENRINEGAKKYADLPFATYFVHHHNGCVLSGTQIKSGNMYKWDRRVSDG